MHIPFLKYQKFFYGLSVFLVAASLLAIALFGLKLGIDFTGGSSLEVFFQSTPPSHQQIKEALKGLGINNVEVQSLAENGLMIKMKYIDESLHQKVLASLNKISPIKPGSESFTSIGPVIGRELKHKTKIVIVISILAILFYIALSFKKVSYPVKSYFFGLSGIIALFHDLLIPLGVFAVLGRFKGVEVTIPVITAFLTILGYSINDSVVVFDRLRETLLKRREPNFALAVERSLNETLVRSINTSFTTLLVLVAIFLFGGETLRYFSLALILGIFFGTYSSLFLATPLLMYFKDLQHKKLKRF